MSFFRCPLCSAPLIRGDHTYTCPGGHSFDRAAAGYVHLLPANRKHSRNPGDDQAMVAARSAFLEKGYYAPLREALTAGSGVVIDCVLDIDEMVRPMVAAGSPITDFLLS